MLDPLTSPDSLTSPDPPARPCAPGGRDHRASPVEGEVQGRELLAVVAGWVPHERTRPEGVIEPRVSDEDAPRPTRSAEDSAERVAAFELFVERHSRELGRLAFLMLGDRDAADDLTGDAFLAAWRQWDSVRAAEHPLAYMRRIVVNMAGNRIRRMIRERRRLVLFHGEAEQVHHGTDTAAVVDVRAALAQLPARRRACVVLRYGFDVSEQDVALMLGVSVGTVKSQTSKGVAQLRRSLGGTALDDATRLTPPGGHASDRGTGHDR